MHMRAHAVIACLLLPSAAALGQLVTQPPEHVPRPEERIAISGFGKEVPHQDVVRPSTARYVGPLPELPLRSLVQRDADGKVLPLSEPIEWAALRNNPLISPEDLARIAPVLLERRRAFDRIVIDNLDLAEQIDERIFEKLDLANNQAFQQLLNVSQPFRPDDLLPLSKSLTRAGLLDHNQEYLNNKISQDYKLATIPGLPPDATPEQKGQHSRRSLALLYKQGLDEPLFELRRMRLAAARSLSKTVPSLGLDPATAKAVTEIADQARPEGDEQATLALIKRINERLTLEQRKQLLRAAANQ
jgi:hypothetical protein